jgi:poly-gamma-glutamate capsule biosynthesis protein CapA/YwtB (metallophosphatase superfamily)
MRRRKRERRMYMLTAVFASLCVFAFIGLILQIKGGVTTEPGTWIVESGEVQVAAPPMDDSGRAAGGAVVIETPAPAILDFLPIVEPTAAPDSSDIPAIEPEQQLATITISAAGDATLGGDYNTSAHERFDSYAEKHGYAYFLENVRDIFEQDDLTFVNLEGPLTTSTDKRGGRIFNFKGAPAYANILALGSVELAGLANNHALDFGRSGLEETVESLSAAGVEACGYQLVYRDVINGISVTCMSVTEWDYTTDELKEMIARERGDCDLLIMMIHWGEERAYQPTDSQMKYGYAMIDAGADLVLGSHSHVVGGIERYAGKYIVYGLGNFCFGGNSNPSDKDAMIFQQTFALDPDAGILDAGIAIVPISVSSVSGTNDYRPTPLTGSEATRVLKKIGGYSLVQMDQIRWSRGMDEYLALGN